MKVAATHGSPNLLTAVKIFGNRPDKAMEYRTRAEAYAYEFPALQAETRMTPLMMWGRTGIPAFLKAITYGEPEASFAEPSPSSAEETIIPTRTTPRISSRISRDLTMDHEHAYRRRRYGTTLS